MPHVIISGMPGIGKTTSVLCLARQLLGDAYKEAVLELNASDERGIISEAYIWLFDYSDSSLQVLTLFETASKGSRRRKSLFHKDGKRLSSSTKQTA
jgi:DNA polymerase III delta prime subunit